MNNTQVPKLLKSLLMLLPLLILFEACNKPKSETGAELTKVTGIKLYKELDAEVLSDKLKAVLSKKAKSMSHPKFTQQIYEEADYQPLLIAKFLSDSGLVKAAKKISAAKEHGLSPEKFQVTKLNAALAKIYSKKEVNTLDQAYDAVIDLELIASAAITDYAAAMQYGVVSPRKIFAQFYTKVLRPDSLSFKKPYQTRDIDTFLDSIQPSSEAYKMLQTALSQNIAAPGHSVEETRRIVIVNMERLRWHTAQQEDKYVWVNIPAFELQVIEKQKPVLSMKVCVGEGRNTGQATSLTEYDENDLKKDRAFNRETPQLKSMIHSVQVNPVWNIPESIASNEIAKYAAQDRYYLSNKNIDVFYKGKKVEDTETIDWSAPDAGKTYTFKQQPGADNSLGKIKFLFNNQSSVYLHDTPAKAAFNLAVRAVSHGCVRLEKPLELARVLFGPGEKFNKIREGMQSKDPKAENISLPKQVAVYLAYFTCWKDSGSGKLMFANDIYGQDAVLYTHLNKA
ncbi:L,D-transpeptidase family protein [uncultured Pedobacter sp.]|uniref:L,D-transpeptidase family protein n=1 Tax=uncultured Pedobacter sp. TaxID=246139 RepID=UPI0025F32943|nr:L,D-transpeptidase family protein [uncultured Pedobacter sp.]